MERFDVVVVGGGTAGLTAAFRAAARGRRVLVVERRAHGRGGARWVNGVPPWMFDRAAVPRPVAPEVASAGFAFHVIGGRGARVTVNPAPMWFCDMRALVTRLTDLAADAGVTFAHRTTVADVQVRDGRLRAVEISALDGAAARTVSAELFIDASGSDAVLRTRVPLTARDCPPVPAVMRCSAAQYVCRIADRDAARRDLERLRAAPGECLSFTGVSGGFSVINVFPDAHLETVDILTGTLDDGAHGSGTALYERARREHPWIGAPLFGGAGTIPLRRPYDRLFAPGLALLGNAACMVFPAHGSGIGTGMIAGELLAAAIGDAGDAGDPHALVRYARRFMVEVGGVNAAYDLFRRMNSAVGADVVDTLLGAGVVTPKGLGDGLDIRMPAPGLIDAARIAAGALRKPRATAQVLPTVARMPAVKRLYDGYPHTPDTHALARFSRRVARVFGDTPDIL